MKIILFANTSWYLFNYCLPLAEEIQKAGCELLLVSPQGEYVDRLKARNLPYLPFFINRRSINPLIEWTTLERITRLYQREKPDIVHHFTTKCIIYGSMAAHSTGVPHIINSVTGMGYAFSGDQLSRKVLRKVIKRLYRRALVYTKVLFQNPNDQNDFIQEKLVLPEQTVLIRSSGVNVDIFKPSPEPPGPPVVILPGRMLYDKGVVEFTKAAQMLRQRNVKARFVLVGEPDPQNLASIPRKKLRSWESEGTVEWWGWREDMAQVYRQAHIICLPSTYREGIPKTLLEAAASGRPIITTDSPGCREVVQSGRNGLLVKMHVVNELADAIQRLVENQELRQAMGQEGRRIAENEFTLAHVIAAILEIYGINRKSS